MKFGAKFGFCGKRCDFFVCIVLAFSTPRNDKFLVSLVCYL